jgi:methyl-accepting chemotaxis protein
MSRLKKKLLLYFILIAAVSISVSAEIILELSTPRFRESFEKGFHSELRTFMPEEEAREMMSMINPDNVFQPLYNLRNRMILLLLVVSGSIFSAFFLFTKDIVSPMDSMVEATKKIADGDLTITVPVMSEDEIGQMGILINDMNVNLQDMIMQIRQEVERHNKIISEVNLKLADFVCDDMSNRIIDNKRMKVSDFKKILDIGREIDSILRVMSADLSALLMFVNMYKTYRSKSVVEISSEEANGRIHEINHS